MSDAKSLVPIGSQWDHRTHIRGEIAQWQPPIVSADRDIAPGFLENKARARDLALTDPYATNSAEITRDAVIGRKFRLALLPDADYLGVSYDEADEWAALAEAEWERYAEGVTFDADAARKNTFTFMMHTVQEGMHSEGEALGIVRAKAGHYGYVTCLQLIEPERLEDPPGYSAAEVRYGVERDEYGEPIAYHIRDAHKSDDRWRNGPRLPVGRTRVERWTETGRPQVLHLMDDFRPGMSRGVSRGMLASLKRMKMLQTFSDAELGRAIMQATWAAVIESELDYQQAMMVLGAGGGNTYGNNLTAAAAEHMRSVAPYYSDIGLRFNGAKVAHLMPGEKLNVVQAQVNGVAFDQFSTSMVRQLAAGLGVSYEDLSRDFSSTSYSAARQSLATIWRHYMRQRTMISVKFAMPYVSAWMEEAIVMRRLPMLGKRFKATEDGYRMARPGLCAGDFISWSKPVIDPVKERTGQHMAMALGMSTLRDEAATEGEDYTKLLRQRAREVRLRDELGLNPTGIDQSLVIGGGKAGNPQEERKARSDGPG